ncbi:MAG: hypothetical protein AAF799_01925 [Myxococcota bacterium]
MFIADALSFTLDGETYVVADQGREADFEHDMIRVRGLEVHRLLARVGRRSHLGGPTSRTRRLLEDAGWRSGGRPGDPCSLPANLALYVVPKWPSLNRSALCIEPDHDVVDLMDLSDAEPLGQTGPTETEWVEVVVLDEDDRPVPLVDYEIRLSDGRVRRGRTDINGALYYDGLPSGTCELVLLDRDESTWDLVAS